MEQKFVFSARNAIDAPDSWKLRVSDANGRVEITPRIEQEPFLMAMMMEILEFSPEGAERVLGGLMRGTEIVGQDTIYPILIGEIKVFEFESGYIFTDILENPLTFDQVVAILRKLPGMKEV